MKLQVPFMLFPAFIVAFPDAIVAYCQQTHGRTDALLRNTWLDARSLHMRFRSNWAPELWRRGYSKKACRNKIG